MKRKRLITYLIYGSGAILVLLILIKVFFKSSLQVEYISFFTLLQIFFLAIFVILHVIKKFIL